MNARRLGVRTARAAWTHLRSASNWALLQAHLVDVLADHGSDDLAVNLVSERHFLDEAVDRDERRADHIAEVELEFVALLSEGCADCALNLADAWLRQIGRGAVVLDLRLICHHGVEWYVRDLTAGLGKQVLAHTGTIGTGADTEVTVRTD